MIYGCNTENSMDDKDVRDAFRCLRMIHGYRSMTTRSTAETLQDMPGQYRDPQGHLKDALDGFTDHADNHRWHLRIHNFLAYVSL